ncbi:MAG: gamma-glutamylcyclotransferase family protein [Akkermansiaceae bacterium]
MKDGRLIFIYGTLRKGGRAHHLMNGAEFVGFGSVEGGLVHVDQYPGLLKLKGERVKGEVYRVSEEMVPGLDQYEGCFESPPHYARERIDVVLEGGEAVETEVYQFLLLEDHHERIVSGDWFDWLQGN